jgi:hypothetical protein
VLHFLENTLVYLTWHLSVKIEEREENARDLKPFMPETFVRFKKIEIIALLITLARAKIIRNNDPRAWWTHCYQLRIEPTDSSGTEIAR